MMQRSILNMIMTSQEVQNYRENISNWNMKIIKVIIFAYTKNYQILMSISSYSRSSVLKIDSATIPFDPNETYFS